MISSYNNTPGLYLWGVANTQVNPISGLSRRGLPPHFAPKKEVDIWYLTDYRSWGQVEYHHQRWRNPYTVWNWIENTLRDGYGTNWERLATSSWHPIASTRSRVSWASRIVYSAYLRMSFSSRIISMQRVFGSAHWNLHVHSKEMFRTKFLNGIWSTSSTYLPWQWIGLCWKPLVYFPIWNNFPKQAQCGRFVYRLTFTNEISYRWCTRRSGTMRPLGLCMAYIGILE
jgi:hypothetical protein